MIGLGSIGKRHLCNLTKALEKRNIVYHIDALRSNHRELEEKWNNVICQQYYRVDDMPEDYDITFITNPTSLHYDTIKKVMHKTKHMFIEKPIFETDSYDVDSLCWKPDCIYYVACPLRHKSIMRYIKEHIVIQEKIISIRVISSSYLPAWRENIDYRNVYSAKKSLGGGVTKDLIHEWDYIIDLFGIPDKVLHMSDHISDLEIDSDDISLYIARYPSMFLEIHLDYIGHKTERMLQLFTVNKRIDVDLIKNIVYMYKNNILIDKYEFPQEDFYMNEMEYFLNCVEGKTANINTVENAYQVLKIAVTEE